MKPGSKVRIVLPAGHALLTTRWFPKTDATGTLERIFKNGTAAVAVNGLPNQSDDGLRTLHIPLVYLTESV